MKDGGLTGLRWLCQITLLALGIAASAQAGPKLDTSDPLGFFTNLASRLLQSELNLSLTRIQVYPTNQYTPAVHRLLQVTANILDATTNRFNNDFPHLPSVFRPLFTNDGGNIFIWGYAEAGTNTLTNPWRDVNISADRDALQADDLVYGIPVIIGAKKGFPNFNEFSMQSVFQITRKLEIVRPALNSPQSMWRTNQMFVIGISNVIGVEAWNSYRTNYARAVDILMDAALTMTLTNNYGLLLTQQAGFAVTVSLASNVWPYFFPGSTNSFLVPLRTNVVFLPDSAVLFNPPGFTTNLVIGWDTSQTFQQVQWGLAITNRLRFFMIDHETQRLIDFVTLEGLSGARDLSAEIRDPDNSIGFQGLWSTNLLSGYLPLGILNQIAISFGVDGGNTANWRAYDLGLHSAKDFEIDYFRVLYGLTPLKYPFLFNTNLVNPVPLSPTKRTSHYLTWQARDPLAHHQVSDLAYLEMANSIIRDSLQTSVQPIRNIGRLNDRYLPWGGNPETGSLDPVRDFSVALKDPLIRMSDNWNFPEAETLSFALLGRVHRGTPWQTVYLKAPAIDQATWQHWVGLLDARELMLTMPTSDWRLAGLIASLLNTNSPRQLVSINDPNTNAWFAVQDGLTVLSNSLSDAELNSFNAAAQFDTITASSNSPQAAAIANAIALGRANQPGQRFRALGDILAVPELSTNSPWLNLSSTIQLQRGISDEAYEKIPAQLLTRLRPDSIGTLLQTGAASLLQFTGFDDYPYAVEVSSNLLDWVSVSTNYPANGVLEFLESPAAGNARRFYRSVLLP